MITRLDNKNEKTALQIVELQKASYKVEADLIGFDKIPPLLEAADDIRGSEETFYGYYTGDTLAGLISYKLSNAVLDIHKLAVHPDYFHRGIAKQLMAFIETIKGVSYIVVCTGKRNTPAVSLYRKLGFCETGNKEVAEGIYIICFKKEI